MKTKKISGMFWHCHHDKLCEYVWDYQERVDSIKENKPANEIKTRLKVFKNIKGKLPKELVKADEKWKEADAKRKEADEKWNEAYDKRKEADEKWKEADAKRNEADAKRKEAYKKYLPKLEKLHKKECGCKEWNGERLIFEEQGK